MKCKPFKIMGILNITPDSFSDGGKNFNLQDALDSAEKMIESGVDIIDVGGESTRPGSESVPVNEEIKRVIPVIKELNKNFPDIKISIDTTKYEVAKIALDNGADIINDISGLQFEPRFAELAAYYDAGIVLMHIQGNPKLMQVNPNYNDVVGEVYTFLENKVQYSHKIGVNKIWADVGIGFGKTYFHNIQLLKHLEQFHKLGVPLVLGISRKSFIGKMLEIENPQERDIATALIHSILLAKGVDIVRVHNVALMNTLRIIIKEFLDCKN
jgi:dihydropteroate synthase